jgi:hypothetical protein
LSAYNLISGILKALYNRNLVGGIFGDLRKSFDWVNHGVLLSKLQFYGFKNNAYKLIKSCLENRYQKVILGDGQHISSGGIIKQGVPQDFILGLLHFLLYINDLTKCTNNIHDNNNNNNNNKTKLILFASLIVTNPIPSDFVKDVNVMFTKINNLFKANLLSLSFGKPSSLPFLIKNSSNIDINISCEDKYLTLNK